MAKRLWRLWGIVRHILSVRGLLQWTGWWQPMTAGGVAGITGLGSILKRLVWPEVLILTLAGFAVTLVAIRCILVWRDGNGITEIPAIPEHPKAIQDNRKRPEITARWIGFRLMLQNTGQAVAVNISAKSIKVSIAEKQIIEMKAAARSLLGNSIIGDINDYTITEWVVKFDSIDKLIASGHEQELTYKVSGLDALLALRPYFVDLNGKASFSLAITYSDTGSPPRVLHSHYISEFVYRGRDELSAAFLGVFEAGADDRCPSCANTVQSLAQIPTGNYPIVGIQSISESSPFSGIQLIAYGADAFGITIHPVKCGSGSIDWKIPRRNLKAGETMPILFGEVGKSGQFYSQKEKEQAVLHLALDSQASPERPVVPLTIWIDYLDVNGRPWLSGCSLKYDKRTAKIEFLVPDANPVQPTPSRIDFGN